MKYMVQRSVKDMSPMCSRAGEYQQFDIWPDEYEEWRKEWYNRVYAYYETLA